MDDPPAMDRTLPDSTCESINFYCRVSQLVEILPASRWNRAAIVPTIIWLPVTSRLSVSSRDGAQARATAGDAARVVLGTLARSACARARRATEAHRGGGAGTTTARPAGEHRA